MATFGLVRTFLLVAALSPSLAAAEGGRIYFQGAIVDPTNCQVAAVKVGNSAVAQLHCQARSGLVHASQGVLQSRSVDKRTEQVALTASANVEPRRYGQLVTLSYL
ncbi:hypothetical protein [Achromobacter piechaudii]|uniref:Fimbrial protein n=1 Tax=Achromobacter piechaudii ATCC 43553 TaxID=742159 RepID=D4XFP1_9BURK|nr:hypothetical protein [Achromobacter piechaudii]EFF74333.1 hypothetical protein HMPREF0004_4288 [Achromobacter piechaudii ATCC 43553]